MRILCNVPVLFKLNFFVAVQYCFIGADANDQKANTACIRNVKP